MNFDYFNWILLPLMIFLSRLADVSLSTLRHIFVSKGFKKLVPILGFFEVLIWLIAIRQVFNNVNNVACYLAWAAGFSAGTYVGMYIEEKLALGLQIIRIITTSNVEELVQSFKQYQQGVTVIDAQGVMGPVKVIFTVVKRSNKEAIINLIHQHSPDAFYSIEEVKNSSKGVFRDESSSAIKRMLSLSK